jgi:PST family polysaccharide transporter
VKFLRHPVAGNALAMGMIQVVSYGSSFLVLIHLTRVLSVATYGVVAFSVGIVQMFAILHDLGFNLSATQKISRFREKRQFVARLTGSVLALKLLAFVAGACVLVTYAALTKKYAAHTQLLMLTVMPLLGHALQPLWFFAGIERMRFLTLFVVIAKVLFVTLVWTMVTGDGTYTWVPIADGVAQLSAGATALTLVYRVGYQISWPSVRSLRYAIRMTSGFFVSRLAATAYSYSGVVVLGLVAAPAAVAVYSFAEQLYRAMHALFSPVVQALYPFMARRRDLRLLASVAVVCTGVAICGGIAGHFLAPYLVPSLFGAKWHGALPVLDVFLVAIGIHVMAMMAGYPLAVAVNRADVANMAVTFGALVYVAIAALLLVTGGVTPTRLAWLLVISETYVLAHCALLLWPMARAMARDS